MVSFEAGGLRILSLSLDELCGLHATLIERVFAYHANIDLVKFACIQARWYTATVSSIGNLEWLQAQRAEIAAELDAVDRLIARAKLSSNGHTSAAATATPRPRKGRTGRHVFKPDPRSAASRALSESRKVLENVAGHALPFANLCMQLPSEVAGSSGQRQYVRLTLQRSGKRAGIEYVDANCVKLIT